jgi:ketosteroid isomerase-like protein
MKGWTTGQPAASEQEMAIRNGWVTSMIAVAVLVGAVPGTLRAQETNSTVESKIVAMEKAWNQAYKYRDKKALGEILDDRIVLVNDDGSLMTKQAFLGFMDKAKASDDQQVSPESMAVHVYGNVAVATGTFQVRGIENGKAFVRRNRFADTWIEKNGNWVCVSASATPVEK